MSPTRVWLTDWPFYPSIVLGLALLTGAYLLAITRWRDRFPGAAPVSAGRIAAFLGGVCALFLALQSPLDEIGDDYLFFVHMVQHLLLTLIAAPLLLYGTPDWLLRPVVVRLPALLRVGRALTRPLPAFALFNVVFIAYHIPGILDLVQSSEAIHAATHVLFIATAVITWWPVLGSLPELPRIPYPAQMLYLAGQTLPGMLLGAILTFAPVVLYQPYATTPRLWPAITPLADQAISGLIMWVGGGTFFLFVFALVFFRWAQLSEAQEPQVVPGQP
ncbi:MAG TPA: cytochrome c oxidase assembly protein [Thermomicrobiales bacterium]|nr:cytochrome c oxidase assembly protein [Thermomicrobiales bacterium]